MTRREADRAADDGPELSLADLPEFVPVRNRAGGIQEIPSRWLGHPTLGKGFTLTPRFRAAIEQRAREASQAAASTGETAHEGDAVDLDIEQDDPATKEA